MTRIWSIALNVTESSTQEIVSPASNNSTDVLLSSRWRTPLRVACLTIINLTLLIWALAIPFRYAQLATVCSTGCSSQQPEQSSMTQFYAAGLSLVGYAAYEGTIEVLFVLVYVVVAALIFWKRSYTRMGLLTSLVLITFGANVDPSNPLLNAHPILQFLVGLLQLIGWLGLGLFLCLFPDGRFVPRWAGIAVLAAGVLILVSNAPFFPPNAFIPFLFGFLVLTLITQIYRYRSVSTLIQRQQTKWVVFGTAIAILGFLGLDLLVQVFSLPQNPNGYGFLAGDTLYLLLQTLIPLSIGMAILRTKLWDIDVVINRALVYGTLTGILALIYFGLIFGLQLLVGDLTGNVSHSPLIIVGSTLVIAALFRPLRLRIQRIIDQRFYRRKYDAARILSDFSATLRNKVDLSQLSEQLVAVVQETMQPQHIQLWLRPSELHRDYKTTTEDSDGSGS
jgi:hypothetical protein